ncbi:unnamed protein product [Closterium sp. NIES-54]
MRLQDNHNKRTNQRTIEVPQLPPCRPSPLPLLRHSWKGSPNPPCCCSASPSRCRSPGPSPHCHSATPSCCHRAWARQVLGASGRWERRGGKKEIQEKEGEHNRGLLVGNLERTLQGVL